MGKLTLIKAKATKINTCKTYLEKHWNLIQNLFDLIGKDKAIILNVKMTSKSIYDIDLGQITVYDTHG